MPQSRPTRDRDTMKARVLANRYEIVNKLGSGNFGTAFLCRDVKRNNQLKVLKEIPVDLKPDETVDANQEAKLLSKLDHPGIVKFYDSFIDGDFFCIVTEYCEGGDLALKIEEYKKARHSFTEETVLDWTIQLLLAADYIHSRRVLHRDLKARNIFIKDNLMKIGDFGISRILMGTADMASTFTGTPYYMSPEVLKHEGYNSQSDIWSIGCIMFEMCTFEHAFSGQGLMAIMKKIVDDEPPDLPSRFSEDLCDVFKKMLIKDPLKRPTAAEVLKYPFILKHIAKMRKSLTDEYKAKHNTSPEIADREASEIACLLREKSHLKDLQSPSQKSNQPEASQIGGQDDKPADKKLTAREKIRQRKMLKSDKEAQILKNITKIQLVDNIQRRQKNKTSLEKTNFPVWNGNEGTVVKQAQAVKNEDILHATGATASSWQYGYGDSDDDTVAGFRSAPRRYSEQGLGEGHRATGKERLTRSVSQKITRPVIERAPKLNATIEGTYTDDRPIAPMRDRMVYDREYSSLDFKDGIPDTPDQANMYYDQFTDFDNDDVIEGDNDDTVKDNQEELINCLQLVLTKKDTEESTIVNDTILGVFGPNVREIKIMNIQAKCVRQLGQEEFEKAYSYLRTARNLPHGQKKSEKEIMSGLKKYVQNPSDCFLVDQLLFLEDQAKLD